MDADAWARAFLSAYACAALVVVGVQVWRFDEGWRVWLLWVVQRIYVPLMFHWRANGRCRFPAHGAGLVIANHRSPVDPLMLWQNNHLGRNGTQRCRIVSFLMAREYNDVPVVGWVCRTMRVIPVARDGHDSRPVRQAFALLREGRLVGVFPEGRINRDDTLAPADTGIAWLALRAGVPVYPVFIEGSPNGKTMVQPFFTPSRVRLIYGEPIDLLRYAQLRKSPGVLQEVTDLLMNRLAELGRVAYSGSTRGDDGRADTPDSDEATRSTNDESRGATVRGGARRDAESEPL
jgi:1-acyl-sn-glycerol-3-phosphate acyltransferase